MAILVTQNGSEVVILPDSAALRVTQVVPEPVILPTTANLQITQVVPEPVILPTMQRLRIAQLSVEVVVTNTVNACETSWTFPAIADYPTDPRHLYFNEIEPDWGNFGHQFGDNNPKFGTLQTARVRYFEFVYAGLDVAQATTLDDHYESTRGALSFTVTHPLTAEVIENVRYEKYKRSNHRKLWNQERSVLLVKFTN